MEREDENVTASMSPVSECPHLNRSVAGKLRLVTMERCFYVVLPYRDCDVSEGFYGVSFGGFEVGTLRDCDFLVGAVRSGCEGWV